MQHSLKTIPRYGRKVTGAECDGFLSPAARFMSRWELKMHKRMHDHAVKNDGRRPLCQAIRSAIEAV